MHRNETAHQVIIKHMLQYICVFFKMEKVSLTGSSFAIYDVTTQVDFKYISPKVLHSKTNGSSAKIKKSHQNHSKIQSHFKRRDDSYDVMLRSLHA